MESTTDSMVPKIQVSSAKLHFLSSYCGATRATESVSFTQLHARYLNMRLML